MSANGCKNRRNPPYIELVQPPVFVTDRPHSRADGGLRGGLLKPARLEGPQMALTDTSIRALKPREKPYKVADERGLYLLVTPSGGRLWKLKFRTQAGV